MRRPLWLSGCGARWTGVGDTHAPVASVTRHSSRTRFHAHCKVCGCVFVKRHAIEKASTQLGASGIGQYRDRTVHMGRCRQDVSIVVSVLSFFPMPISGHVFFLGGSLVGLCCILDSRLKAHMARSSQQEWTEAAGRGESFRATGDRGVEGSRDKAKHRRDKATGESAIRKHEVANVDLLSLLLTVLKVKVTGHGVDWSQRRE